jgi:hypothetical protein
LAYRVRRSADTDRDLDAIFDFLVQTALDFGESIETAHDRAASLLVAIERDIRAIGAARIRARCGRTWPRACAT